MSKKMKLIRKIKEICENTDEVNLSNFSPLEVETLDNALTEIFDLTETFLSNFNYCSECGEYKKIY